MRGDEGVLVIDGELLNEVCFCVYLCVFVCICVCLGVKTKTDR